MKLRLKKIAKFMLCLPLAPIIGIGGIDNVDSNTDSNANETQEPNLDNGENNNSVEKTFTQSEVNRMMKKEKESGKRSVLQELGMTDIKDAKEALKKYQEYLDAQKSDLEKATEELNNIKNKAALEEARANKAEYCLQAISKFEANPNTVEDLVSIISSKITAENNFSAVMEEIKKNEAYSGFFISSVNNNRGTGNPPSNRKPNESGNKTSYGARLAEIQLARIGKKTN